MRRRKEGHTRVVLNFDHRANVGKIILKFSKYILDSGGRVWGFTVHFHWTSCVAHTTQTKDEGGGWGLAFFAFKLKPNFGNITQRQFCELPV
jgi:hypothetical protein